MNKIFSLRLPFLRMWVTKDPGVAELAGNFMFSSNLEVVHIRDGKVIDRLDNGSGTVTLAGVVLLAADGTNSTATLKTMTFHDSGSGTIPTDINQVGLQAPLTGFQVGGRASGILSSSVNVYSNVGTIQYSAAKVVTEWGLFNGASGGTMWDRQLLLSPFSVAINDQLQFIYKLTIIPGG